MAKELGLNPRSLIKNIPSPGEPWKAPVRIWIQDLYRKRKGHGKPPKPPRERKPPAPPPAGKAKAARPSAAADHESEPPVDGPYREPGWETVSSPPVPPEGAEEFFGGVELDEEDEDPDPDAADQDLLRRQKHFRIAAEFIARELSKLPEVERVVLFGSVAVPLGREVPRFREFRRKNIALFHECKDLDLAVWLRSFDRLKELQRARSKALNRLLKKRGIGVAHHQVEFFLFERESGRHVGRVCHFGACPKEGKLECRVPGCGASPFLRVFPEFTLQPEALDPAKSVVLFDRSAPVPPAPRPDDPDAEGGRGGGDGEIPF